MPAPAVTVNHSMTAGEWSLLALLSLLWGGTFFFVEVGLTALSPFTLVFLRVSLAATALMIGVRALGYPLPRSFGAWRPFLIMGVLNNVIPFSLIFWGQTELTGGLAAIFNATTPLFTAVLAHFVTDDEKLSGGRVAGLLLGLAGVAVMMGPTAFAGPAGALLAQIAILAASLSYGVAGLFARRAFRAYPPLTTAACQLASSALMMLPIAAMVDRPWTIAMPGFPVLAAVLGLALISTALAYLIYFRILKTAGATNLLLVTLLIPASAALLGALFLGEVLAPGELAGMGLIALGLLSIDGRIWRLRRRDRTAVPR